MNSSSSFMELRNKRKFDTSDNNEESKEISTSDNNEESKEISTSDVNANVSEGTTMITMKSKRLFKYEFIDFDILQNRAKILQEAMKRKALWFKTDTMTVIQDKSKVNLCLFYSILNGLPTYDQKFAFTEYYTGSDPSTKFLIFNNSYSTRDHENLGFIPEEIIDWLKYLQRNAIILNFVYKRQKSNKSFLNKLFFSEKIRDENIIHLFEGWSPVYDNKNKKVMINCLNGSTPDFVGIPSAEDYKNVEGSQRLINMKAKVYEMIGSTEDPALSSFRSESVYSHTISVRWSNEHNAMLIFDTEKQNVIKLRSVEDFSKHLHCYIKVYV